MNSSLVIIIAILILLSPFILMILYYNMRAKGLIFGYSKRSLMTSTEKKFYRYLFDATRSDFIIFSQVRLGSIISLPNSLSYSGKSYYKNFAPIAYKTLDFVLCDAKTLDVKIVIELDDWTHGLKDRISRDSFVDKALKSANIAVLHVSVSSNYDVQKLRNNILFASK